MSASGLFVTFEGIEGAGKTTQISLLADFLTAKGYEVITLREPGGTQLGDRIRDLLLTPCKEPLRPMAEFLLFCASRNQLVESIIRPALERGQVVLCDRFYDSSIAYQGFARGLALETIKGLTDVATAGVKPTRTFLLDLPVERGLERARVRRNEGQDDRFEAEALDFHRRVREGFLTLAREEPQRIKVIDADRPSPLIAESIQRLIEDGLSGYSWT